ncbi:unnamed protein product [Prunus armeniaca]
MNGELEEENFMRQPKEFANEGKEHMVCKLGKAIYGLKQASRRWIWEKLGIEIQKDRARGLLGPSQKTYIEKECNFGYGKKVLRYLQRTKAYMLIYRCTENLELVGYADANLGKAEDDYISTSGFLFKMARVAVAWKSAKQTSVSSSTMFSEYIACYEATSHAIWLRNFIKDIKVVDSISKPIQIYNDNTAAVFHCMNNKMSSRLQHIDRKYLIVKEKIADKLVRFDHIRTQDMIADPFTKFLPSEAFLRHVESMGLFLALMLQSSRSLIPIMIFY